MRPVTLATVLSALTLLGCAGPRDGEPIPTREVLPVMAPLPPEVTITKEPNPLDNLMALRRGAESKLIAAQRADECPMIKLTTLQGKEIDLQPGRAGYVTLVVFWMMDSPKAQACVQHISDLAGKYSSVGVRAVGVVQVTRFAEDAPDFAGRHRLRMPLYYDNRKQSALRELADEVGAEEERAVPAIFIIDRRLKLRFYRPGFRYAKQAVVVNGRWQGMITEDAAEGESIEDYLQQILKESW